MNDKSFTPMSPLATTSFAAAAAAIAVGLLSLVVHVFRSDGVPMEQLVAAERACQQSVFVSEREQCMNEWLAAAAKSARFANK